MSLELKRPWERHTCNTLHFLMEAHAKYPDLVDAAYLRSSLKTPVILTPLAHKHLGRIFWGTTSMGAIAHPSYDALSRHLLAVERSQLVAFWSSEINETLAAPNRIKEVVTLRLLTDLLNDQANPLDAKTTLLKLLTPRFIRMIVSSLKTLRLQKHDVLVTFYAEFFDALNAYFEKLGNDDSAKVELLQRLLLHPGSILLEKYLPQNTIHQLVNRLGHIGARSLFATYKAIFVGQLAKDPQDPTVEWLNVERLHACQMMQYLLGQKSVQTAGEAQEWRTEQLTFLMTVGLFNTNASGDVVVAAAALAKPLAASAKSAFFASLQMRLTSLSDEKTALLGLVDRANEIVSKNKPSKYITAGVVWNAEAQAAWQQMYAAVRASTKAKKLTIVFQILFLHMGLQLFREPEMARLAIADLVQCMEKTRLAKKAQKKARKSKALEEGDVEDEPEWIEVVVDLFLHLLSQNASFLRTIVANVFPHLCPELTLTAVHQILAVLDMKDGRNPLSIERENDDDEEDAEDGVKSSDEEEDEDEDGEDDSDEDDDDDIQDEDGTVSDQLRNAVSNALGAALNDPDNDGAESVDLDDMDDAEAERLDGALSSAFAMLRRSGAHQSTTTTKKKTRKERSNTTTVMHFRIRVIDLIEIYVKAKPSLAITIEIMLALLGMIEYCKDGQLRPLSDKIDRVLRHLLALRHFDDVSEVSCEDVRDLLKSLVEKWDSPTRLGAHSQLLSRSFVFLISNASQLPDANDHASVIVQLIQSYAREFIASSNPSIPNNLLQDIFRIRWTGVWQVAETVAEQGLRDGPAASLGFRRTQALEQLIVVYRNHGFVKTNVSAFAKSSAKIERSLQQFLSTTAAAAAGPNSSGRKVSPKGFAALCALLTEVSRTQKAIEYKCHLKWNVIQEQVQTVRKRLTLNSVQLQSYTKFCKSQGLTVIKRLEAVFNGGNHDADEDDDVELLTKKDVVNGNGVEKASRKRKPNAAETNGESKKEKRQRREERLRLASIGLDPYPTNDEE